MWSLGIADPVVVNFSKQAITIGVDGVHISLVHAISVQTTRRNLWRQLDMGALQLPWLAIGDFNCVLRNDEKKGGATPRTAVVNEFSDWLDDNGLFEAECLGCKFTWSNRQSGVHRIISRLDRAVINEFWLNRFENWQCKALPREVSDHSPLIGFPFVNTRPRRAPFRVQKMWFGHPDFMRMVEDSWKEPIVGSPTFIYPQNLKRLEISMKLWNQEVFGNVNVRLKQAQDRLESSMRLSDEDPSDVDKLNSMRSVAVEVNDIRMSSNIISELVDANGVTATDCNQIRNLIVDYYEAKFNGDDSVPVEALFNIDHNSISLEESARMDQLPSIDEIHAAVFDLGADSAPGPDGFAGFFYRHCWEIIWEDLVNAIMFCWSNRFIPHGVNSSLLMLLPKERGANTLRNFRPTGLSNFFLKIFTKILATGLGSVLDNLISEEQVAFMKRGNIHENISLVSEMVNKTQIRRKDGNVGLKLDITQAFDAVSWTFILEVFRRYGFSESWCDWILQIVKSARISVLVWYPGRNIPKLFREGKMTHMVNIKGIAPSHLFFADDIMIFYKDRYLGVKVMPEAIKYHHVANVVEKIKEQVAGWKGRMLSFQDRVVLNFLWSGDSKVSRSFVVAYDKICAPYEEGGLGITQLSVTNRALLMGLWWKIRNSSKVWARFLRAKFFMRNAKLVHYVKSSILPGIKWVYSLVEDNSKVLIGDGCNTSLYYDVWLGDVAIADLLEDYALDCAILVGDMLNEGGWNLSEECQNNLLAAGFVDLAKKKNGFVEEDLPRNLNGIDRGVWKPNYTGSFTVSSAKSLIRKKYAKMVGANLLWRPTVHPALAARNWKILRGACATLDKVMEYSRRLKGHMNNTVEDLKVLDFFKVSHRKVKSLVPVECRQPKNDEKSSKVDAKGEWQNVRNRRNRKVGAGEDATTSGEGTNAVAVGVGAAVGGVKVGAVVVNEVVNGAGDNVDDALSVGHGGAVVNGVVEAGLVESADDLENELFSIEAKLQATSEAFEKAKKAIALKKGLASGLSMRLKEAIKLWNQSVFGNVNARLKQATRKFERFCSRF
ncbi:uncharacterized protein LOC113342278 [Papaver somniferum]|uniref:uncharacterized protein LOC113342278 n=1 Tax=Papaver somniferum TaxID=3469 RepID=UPI000E6F5239|nr:uncharacterized protein LOC113342278 [Papaver somniferum]